MSSVYPENTVCYIEASSQEPPHNDGNCVSSGSGVVVRLRNKRVPGSDQRYLLTCAHVIRGQSSEGVSGYGPLLEHIRVWQAGKGYTPKAAMVARVAGHIRKIDSESITPQSQIAVDDWVILEVLDETFRKSAFAAREFVERKKKGELSIVGYPGGSDSFSGFTVVPSRSDGFQFKVAHDRLVRLHGDQSRRGMSGGGLFNDNGGLVGIHRSRTDRTLECHSLSASYIREELDALGYEVVENPIPAPLIDREAGEESGVISRRKLLIATATGLSAIAGGVWYANRPTQILVGVKQWIGYTPLAVAKSLNLFPSDIDVVFKKVALAENVQPWLENGTIHIGFWTVADHVKHSFEIYKSQPHDANRPVAILKIDTSRGADGIVARQGINSVEDLVGKDFLIQTNDVSEFMLKRYWALHSNLPFANLKCNATGSTPEAAPDAFMEDEKYVAAGTYEPHISELLRKIPNSKVILHSGMKGLDGLIVDLAVTNHNFQKRNPEVIIAFLTGWFRAVELLNNATHKDHDAATELARQFNGKSLVGEWKVDDWMAYPMVPLPAYRKMVSGLSGSQDARSDPGMNAWPDLAENKSFFRAIPMSDKPTKFHEAFNEWSGFFGYKPAPDPRNFDHADFVLNLKADDIF